MSFCSEEKTVVARKVHRCHWCGQRIEIGSQYVTYCYGNDDGVTRMKMHPECHAACGKWVEQTGDTEFDAYTWTRGCTCEAGDRGHGSYPTCVSLHPATSAAGTVNPADVAYEQSQADLHQRAGK